MKKKFIGILDAKVLKVGMRVETCLDCDSPMANTDDGDIDGPDDCNWFKGKIIQVSKRSSGGYMIYIQRDGQPGTDTWQVDLNDDNLEFLKVETQLDWD